MGELPLSLRYNQLMMNYWEVCKGTTKTTQQKARKVGRQSESVLLGQQVKWQKRWDYLEKDTGPQYLTQILQCGCFPRVPRFLYSRENRHQAKEIGQIEERLRTTEGICSDIHRAMKLA